MIDDDALYDTWADAARRAHQPQILYPHLLTLREFARLAWHIGRIGEQDRCPF
jgi:hypothetical protein